MKKLCTTLVAIVAIVQFSYAQWAGTTNIYNTNSGYVGIGTTSPAYKLVVSNAGANGLEIDPANSSGTQSVLLSYNRSTEAYTPMLFAGSQYIFHNGNVGIGTTSPSGKFQVKNGSYDLLTAPNTVDIGLGGTTGGWARSFRIVNTSGSNGQNGGAFGVVGYDSTPEFAYISIPTADPTGYNSTKILVLNNSGNVGIGTTDPKGYKLAVAGNVIAESVTVKLQGNWPDYVFKPKYSLPSLATVKSYIDKYQHLPEIPSEQEVIKNGVNVGDMLKLQTKKIEELTLYLIEKDRQVNDQANKLIEQEKTNKSLQQQINNLAKQITRTK